MRSLLKLLSDDRGASAVEYGLILAMVFLAMIVGVQNFGDSTINMWNYVSNEVLDA